MRKENNNNEKKSSNNKLWAEMQLYVKNLFTKPHPKVRQWPAVRVKDLPWTVLELCVYFILFLQLTQYVFHFTYICLFARLSFRVILHWLYYKMFRFFFSFAFSFSVSFCFWCVRQCYEIRATAGNFT